MADIIKMDYQCMDDMAKTFGTTSQNLEDLRKKMQKVAEDIDGGALIGSAGSAFSEGIREVLCPAIEKLAAKMKELNGDVMGALVDLRDEDHESASRFK